MKEASFDIYASAHADRPITGRALLDSRDAWLKELDEPQRHSTLFELEMLLRGLSCLDDPRNQAGPPERAPAVDHDYQQELRILRQTTRRLLDLTRSLLGVKDRAYAFSAYVETALQSQSDRTSWLRDQLTQEHPRDSLFLLRNVLSDQHEILEALARTSPIQAGVYHASVAVFTRELARNVHFNPFTDFVFRREFDRVDNPAALRALDGVESSAAHRIVAVTLLSLQRCLRYLDLVQRYVYEKSTPLAWPILATFRHDIRALAEMLRSRAADAMADGLEQEILAVRASQIRHDQAALSKRTRRLAALRAALQRVGVMLSSETRLCFELDLPPAHGLMLDPEALGERIGKAAVHLRACLELAVDSLCAEVDGSRSPQPKRDDLAAYEEDLLRRHLWMFARIVRAFVAKAGGVPEATDRWSGMPSLKFVRDYVAHYRVLGVPLVRVGKYPRALELASALSRARAAEVPSRSSLEAIIDESLQLGEHLEQHFVRLAEVARSRGTFDKRRAADTLRIYLDEN